jgi:FKBP-type peptidyl-prolyl cis-trans isomerase
LSTTDDSSHLIPGFAAGLVGMKVGGTRRIDIPASQAYGANPPAGSGIPVNSELVFEVTLVSTP